MPKPKKNAAKQKNASTASSRSKLPAKKKSAAKGGPARSAKPAGSNAAPSKPSKKSALKTTGRSVSSSVTKAMSDAMSKVTSSARKVAKAAEETDFRGGAKRVGGAIASATRSLTSKLHLSKSDSKTKAAAPKAEASKKAVPKQAAQPLKKTPPKTGAARTGASSRPTKRTADVALDELANNYTPGHTSLKTSFRERGVARTRDQEMAGGFSDDRWNDEDHFTNKSGDPRIGTHGRTYEPDEKAPSGKKS